MDAQKRNRRREIWNAPNIITYVRILAIPVFVYFLSVESRRNSFVAALIFAAAAITDVLDGWLARRFDLTTVLGKFLDPLADKLIVLAALILLVHLGRVPPWVVVLIMSREFAVSGLRTLAVSDGLVISASQGGKWKTATQLTGIICLSVHYRYPIDFLFRTDVIDFHEVGLGLLYISLVPSVLSALDYFRAFMQAVTAQPEK